MGSDATDAASTSPLLESNYAPIPSRKLSQATCEKYGYSTHPQLGVQVANYHDAKGQLVAQKLKRADKSFSWVGNAKAAGLFGAHLWAAGGKRIVITEGEVDALSASQALGNTWPVVSVKNGAQSARRELSQHIEYLSSYGEVVLCFDSDAPGRAAASGCAELFAPGKCRLAALPLKDASDMVQAGRVRELVSAIWQAKAYQPDGLIEGSDLWEAVAAKPEKGLSYPWPCLDVLLHGQRVRELVCWAGGTGIGKTQFLREVAYDLATRHKQRVGYIALEENTRDVAIGQMSLAANQRLHLPEVRDSVADTELRRLFDSTMGSGQYLLCDPKWVRPEQLLNRIRYMVLGGGCRWIIFDHISMTVGIDASSGGDERKRLDELVYGLRALVDELGFGIHFVTHLRKRDGTPYEEGGRVSISDLRGTGGIGQVATAAIAIERDQQSQERRGVSTLRVLKNRFSGETSIAGEIEFDSSSGRLTPVRGGQASESLLQCRGRAADKQQDDRDIF
jgi:twinkle protein